MKFNRERLRILAEALSQLVDNQPEDVEPSRDCAVAQEMLEEIESNLASAVVYRHDDAGFAIPLPDPMCADNYGESFPIPLRPEWLSGSQGFGIPEKIS